MTKCLTDDYYLIMDKWVETKESKDQQQERPDPLDHIMTLLFTDQLIRTLINYIYCYLLNIYSIIPEMESWTNTKS